MLSRVWLPINWTAEQMGVSLSQLYQHGTFETAPSQLFVMGIQHHGLEHIVVDVRSPFASFISVLLAFRQATG